MNKKRILCSLVLACVLSCLAGCGNEEYQSKEQSKNDVLEEVIADDVEIEEKEDEDNPYYKTVVLPKEWTQNIKQEDLNQMIKDYGFTSATILEDGSVEYVMSRKVYEEYVEELRDNSIISINDFVLNEENSSFTDLKMNDNLTEFEITCNTQELTSTENFTTVGLLIMSAVYNCVIGNEDIVVYVNYVDQDGNIFREWNSDMIDDAENEEAAEVIDYSELSDEEYKELCQQMYYDDILFSEENLKGDLVKVKMMIGAEMYFKTDALYNTDFTDFAKEWNLKRNYFEVFAERENETSYVGESIYLMFSDENEYTTNDFEVGNYIIVYGEIIDYSVDNTDGFNNCYILPRIIEMSER